MLAGCGKKDEDNANPNEPGQHTDPVTKTATIVLAGDTFNAVFPNSGVHFDTTNNLEKLTKLMNDQIGEEGVLKTLIPINAHTGALGSDSTVFQFGGSSDFEGSLTWKSEVNISKVEATVENYNKFITNSGVWSIDNAAHFKMEEDDHDLTYMTAGAPEEKTFEYSYETPVKEFHISSYDGRVFVKQLKVTYTI